VLKKITVLLILAAVFFGQNGAFAGTVLEQEKYGTVYKIDVTLDSESRMMCAKIYKNERIEEIYNVVIEDVNDQYPIFADTFTVDAEKNRTGCFNLPNIPEEFDLYIIKFDPEQFSGGIAHDIPFNHIKLSSLPVY